MSGQLAKMARVIKRSTLATSILSFRSFAFAVAFVLSRFPFAFAFSFSFGASFSAFGEKQRAATFVASSLTFQRVQFVAPVRRMRNEKKICAARMQKNPNPNRLLHQDLEHLDHQRPVGHLAHRSFLHPDLKEKGAVVFLSGNALCDCPPVHQQTPASS